MADRATVRALDAAAEAVVKAVQDHVPSLPLPQTTALRGLVRVALRAMHERGYRIGYQANGRGRRA